MKKRLFLLIFILIPTVCFGAMDDDKVDKDGTIKGYDLTVKNPWVDVRAYGADPTGVSDSVAAIQGAINAVYAAGGGVVFLPKGTYLLNTVSGGIYLLKAKSGVSVIGQGPESVLKAGDNLRDTDHGLAILYDHTEALSNIVYRDFTVDFNGQNNLVLSGYGPSGKLNRMGGHAGNTNILVEKVHFLNSAGYHFLCFIGGGSNVVIRNCTFNEEGTSISGNQITDHSSIYIDADNVIIEGNNFVNSTQSTVGTAIEIHGNNNRAQNNHAVYYRRLANLCADVKDASGTEFHHNTAIHVKSGIALFSASSYLGSHWNIHDNIIGLAESDESGILGDNTRLTSTRNLSHVSIRGNEIYQETFVTDTHQLSGIYVTRIDDLLIANNNIHDLWREAIKLQTQPTRSINRVQIIGNKIKDVGLTSTTGNKRAIAFNAYNVSGGEINNIDVKDNVITLSTTHGTVANYGIEFNNGSFPNTRIVNNTIRGAARSPIK